VYTHTHTHTHLKKHIRSLPIIYNKYLYLYFDYLFLTIYLVISLFMWVVI